MALFVPADSEENTLLVNTAGINRLRITAHNKAAVRDHTK